MDIAVKIISTVLIFGIIIFIHELGHFLSARAVGIKVNEFALGMGPTIFKIKPKQTIYAIRIFPIGGFVSMEGEDETSHDNQAFCNKKTWQRIIVVIAGAMMNIILGFGIILAVTSTQKFVSTTIIADFMPNAVSSSQLKTKDEVLRVNGRKVHTVNDIGLQLMKDDDGKVDIVLNRDGKTITENQVAFNMEEVGEGIKVIQMDFQVYGKEPTFIGVIKESYYWTKGIMEQVYVSLVDLVTGKYGLKQLSGPVGVSEVIGKATSQGVVPVLMMTALLSLNIGVFNLLPLPALDGGRLVFLLIELIFRKPVPAKYEGYVHATGLILLMGLMVIVTFSDILKLF